MNLKVYYENEQNLIKTDISLRNLVRRSIIETLNYERFDGDIEVSVVFTDNEKIRTLNSEYRGKDSATDVLSFPMYDFKAGDLPIDDGIIELGDIVLSLERAKEQSMEFGHSFKREVSFLTVHSVLHLLGYDHELSEKDEKEMFDKQNEIMKLLKITREDI